MDDLRRMDNNRPHHLVKVPPALRTISSPLRADDWEAELQYHPDQEFAGYLVSGIRNGFRIGYDYGAKAQANVKASKNMHSARAHPEPIDDYIGEELRLGRVIHLEDGEDDKDIRVSRFGVIPKPHQPGKWRLITDLSSPKGSSVNDGIDSAVCSVSYASLDDAVRIIVRLGRGALLAKFDIANAYRIIAVHP